MGLCPTRMPLVMGDRRASLLPFSYCPNSPIQAALGSDPTIHTSSPGGRNRTVPMARGVGRSAAVDRGLCNDSRLGQKS